MSDICSKTAGSVQATRGRQASIFRAKHWLMGKQSTVIEAVRGVSETLQTAKVITVQHIQDNCHVLMI